ncbi:acyl-CoA dehydrogenase family protein [Micromonospora sp. NPDC023956]|uniref:acyl-CoA dehydrogenase family protein n=1 Tax=Micromonospora sp. NPDC023956 TaxID=3155722 RepID=UPI0033D2EB8D
MRDTIRECEHAGHTDGLAVGLGKALSGTAISAAPGGIAAVPSILVAEGAPVIPHEMASREGISFVRSGPSPAAPAELTALGARLGAVRLGVTRRLVERVVEHLAHRIVGGEPTLRKQLVQGTLADARLGIEAARRCLLVAGHLGVAVADVHDRLTALDWELAKLLGASGYVGQGPASSAYVSRLTANCWIRREGVSCPS